MVPGRIAGILIIPWAFTSEVFPPNAPIEINVAATDVMNTLMAPSSPTWRSVYSYFTRANSRKMEPPTSARKDSYPPELRRDPA
jgi:hypothetical protein